MSLLALTKVNEMGVATIVSILPYPLNEYKPGLIPPRFLVPKAEDGDFVVVHIEDCINHVYILDGKSITRTIPGEQVAGSVARDHINDSLEISETAYPGIHALSGKHEKKDVTKNFPELLDSLQQAQRAWFGRLVARADDTWSDPNGRGKHMAISDLQRYAAKFLGLNREWTTSTRIDQKPCPACTIFIPENAILCPNCKTVLKPEEYGRLQAAK